MAEALGIPMEVEETEAGSSRGAPDHAISAASNRDKNEADEREEPEGEIPGDGDEIDEDEDEDDDEEEEEGEGEGEEEECAFRFKSGTNPLDYVGDAASGVQIYQQFERLEYEALAKKKRQGLAEG